MASLTALPADGYTVRWQRWDDDGDETLQLRWENEGWTAIGEVARERITYVMRLSPMWHARQFLLFRDLQEPDLWLGTDGNGRWGEMNGAHRVDLDGCVDIELSCTPFTATVPIRRHDLAVGDSIDIHVAHVDVDTLGVVPRRRRFHRSGARRWTINDLDEGVDIGPFEIDDYGLAQDVVPHFRRR